jgi:hypothetical protein
MATTELEPGMRVRCVAADPQGELTEGAEYRVRQVSPYTVKVEGHFTGFARSRFEPITAE